MIHPYTLGYNPNPILEKFKQAFLLKLQALWKVQMETSIFPSEEFLLYPDIHILLLKIVKCQNQEEKTTFIWILKEKYESYSNIWLWFFENQEENILGTNIRLTLDFINPDVSHLSHPDHKWIVVWYWEKSPDEWRKLYGQAFSILSRLSPWFMSEVNMLLRKIIPYWVSNRVHNSWSYTDAIGHILMSYPTGMDHPEIALLEAILHEYNHNKINLIMQTEELVLNDRREQYYSPYRPDPRHIHGIYLGIHALAWAYWVILNAHNQWIIELPTMWLEKAMLYIFKNGLSLQILDKYAILSPLGKEVLEEMREVHNECLAFIKESWATIENINNSKQALMHHYKTVQNKHPWILC